MSIVDSVPTFDDLELGFQNKFKDLKLLIGIRSGWSSDTRDEMNGIVEVLQEIAADVEMYRSYLASAKRQVEFMREMSNLIASFSKRADHMTTNMPTHVPCLQSSQDSSLLSLGVDVSKPKSMPPSKQKENVPMVPSKKQTTAERKGADPVPKIKYISLEEYERVPKYTKGRIPYEKVNTTIDALNACLEKKYELLKKPRSKLSPMEMSAVAAYKNQITTETKKSRFFVEDDVKKFTALKLDTAGRNILTILRTLKRLKEVRGPAGLVRFCVLT